MRLSAGVKVLGIDDGPFPPGWTGPVGVVGAMYLSGESLEGVLCTSVTKDGDDATERLVAAITGSRFFPQLHLLLLHGLTFGGFNVVDLPHLHQATGLPVLSVTRKKPDLHAMERALGKIPNGPAKLQRLLAAGPVREWPGLYGHPHGLSESEAETLLRRITRRGKFPEPLRAAHLIAGALATGESRGRP